MVANNSGKTIPNLLNRSHEVNGNIVTYRFGNGLIVKTEIFKKNDPQRILPLGGPQGTLMNFMLNSPEKIKGADVFEPFAGSGVLGLMALKIGAQTADFLDVNPRAKNFQEENAHLNNFDPSRFHCYVEDLAAFKPERKYDLIFANPPFVPTPDGIDGTLTSNGGPEGNRLVEILINRLEHFLKPNGESFIYVFQMLRNGKPIVADIICKSVDRRHVEITSTQAKPIKFDVYYQSYLELFPQSEKDIREWGSKIIECYGKKVSLNHYVIHIGRQGNEPTSCSVLSNIEEKYGEGFLSQFDEKEFAKARISENLLGP
ncbi:methyltransferase [Planctomycetota bacterium]